MKSLERESWYKGWSRGKGHKWHRVYFDYWDNKSVLRRADGIECELCGALIKSGGSGILRVLFIPVVIDGRASHSSHRWDKMPRAKRNGLSGRSSKVLADWFYTKVATCEEYRAANIVRPLMES